MDFCSCYGPNTSAVHRLEVYPQDKKAKSLSITIGEKRNSPLIHVVNRGPGTAHLVIESTKNTTLSLPIPAGTSLQNIGFFTADDLLTFRFSGMNTNASVEIVTAE